MVRVVGKEGALRGGGYMWQASGAAEVQRRPGARVVSTIMLS